MISRGTRRPDATKSGAAPPAYRGEHAIVPLPFGPGKLRGISEAMIVSHHDNNYASALESLNKVEAALGRLTKDSAPFEWAGLKERHATFSNSVTLHELYFANLGGGGRPAGEIVATLTASYGTLGRWEEEFRATGMGLAGGSGWVTLDYELDSGTLRTHASGNHTQARASALPLLVMDMYEHAYQMDYGAAAPKYIDAFFDNLHWQEVERRLARALKARDALLGR